MNPVDIHGYQPPWKALSEFAVQADMERLDPGHPSFQHIMGQVYNQLHFRDNDFVQICVTMYCNYQYPIKEQ